MTGIAGQDEINIGGVSVDNPVWLAPLAGITVPSVRLFFRRLGAGLTHTEMISCAGLIHGSIKTFRMLRILDGERPVVLQLFAGDEKTLLEGAGLALSASPSFDAIGINMACPMPKVLRKGAGARLLERPDIAGSMVRSLRGNGLPVWVKTRKMPSGSPMDTRDFTGMLLDAGASQVCIHGRSPVQRYGGSSDREVIIETASAFPGMVAGSGDVFCSRDAAELLEGGCAAVFVARGAFRDPFLIPVILDELGFDVDRKLLSREPGSRIEMMQELGALIVEEEGERAALLLLKRFLSGIFKGLRGASLFRRSVGMAANWREMHDILQEWKVFAERGEHLDR